MKFNIMDNPQNIVCCGCLSIGRKMIKIDLERKECFHQILGDLQTVADFKLMYLCWECTSRLSNFIKFKSQVRYAHKCLQDIEKDLKLVSQSKLNTQNTLIINYDPETSEELDWHIAASEEKETPSDQQCSETETVVQPKKKIKKASKSKRLMHLYKEIELTESDIEAERDTEASSDSFVNALFKCEKCVEAFPNQEDLNDHNLKKHNKRLRFSCLVCECYFGTAAALSYHANKHRIRYQCRSCRTRFGTKSKVLSHHAREHSSKPDDHGADSETTPSVVAGLVSEAKRANGKPVCVPCNRTFSSIATFKQHMKMSMKHVPENDFNAGPYSCEICEKKFRWTTSLRKHMETHRIERGQKRKPYCESCRLSFTTSANLRKHVKTSSRHQIILKLRKLDVHAEDSPENQARLEEIRCSVTESKQQHYCPECDKKFLWRGNLLRHLKSHQARANGNLVCVPCNRKFSSIATFKQHMKMSMKHISENDFNYMCSDCGNKFVNKTRLKDHINWEHLKNYIHRCSDCKKVFKTRTSLYLHRQMVHKEMSDNHLCDHCGKRFPSQARLHYHITALHNKETPYKCTTCSARFSWHSCLTRHVRTIHSKEKKSAT
ncbi:zinc finger protein 91 isoform X1 [Bombyx mori]|uniref:C2H2-type domain-containing protein n=1 Tax=Bombyx mori TaxID=7091 RepID=A0A8R2C7L7_BOMMO|nr:zinc finger protein 91 isoform X1 [Bombyx mori]